MPVTLELRCAAPSVSPEASVVNAAAVQPTLADAQHAFYSGRYEEAAAIARK